MRKPRIASELTAAELSSAELSVEDSERGDASTEFVMVGALLVLLTMAILQVSFALCAHLGGDGEVAVAGAGSVGFSGFY